MKSIFSAIVILAMTGPAIAETAIDYKSEAFGEAVKAYLMEHPEVILESVDKYNADAQAKAENAAAAELPALTSSLFDEKTGFILGKADAKFTIVEFVDYNCGYCRKAHEAVDAILKSDPDVKVVVRQFPILSQGSLEVALIALAINETSGSEKAAAFHEAAYLYEGSLDKAAGLEIAKSQGLDVAAIETASNDPKFMSEISSMNEAAKKLEMTGTPGFIIGEQIIRGYIPQEGLSELIASERKKS